MVITKVNAVSVAKVAALLYAGLGLIFGALFSLVGMAWGNAMANTEGGAFFGAIFGVGAIIILPICYGILGFIVSFISALLFNVAAGMTGGIEIETK